MTVQNVYPHREKRFYEFKMENVTQRNSSLWKSKLLFTVKIDNSLEKYEFCKHHKTLEGSLISPIYLKLFCKADTIKCSGF